MKIAVSLFDGMGCLAIALRESGIKPDSLIVSETDKNCIAQTELNFPDAHHVGDVVKFRQALTWSNETWIKMLDSSYISKKTKVDMIMKRVHRIDIEKHGCWMFAGGSPCQGFSFSGKQLNFKDPRSRLFFEYVKIKEYLNPKHFILENVPMLKSSQKVINDYMGLFPVEINASLVSAQNRRRLYWTNIKTRSEGLFGDLYTDIPQPKDIGIMLKDILEPEEDIDEKYYIKFKAGELSSIIEDNHIKHNDALKMTKDLKIKGNQNKASCITGGGHSGGNHSDMDVLCVRMIGRNTDNPSSRKSGLPTKQRFESNSKGKTNCLTTVQKDNMVFTKNYVQYDVSGKGMKSQQDRAYYLDGKHGTLPSSRTDSKTGVLIVGEYEYRIRRLTPLECSRLQSIPSWYKWDCANTNKYKMLGNGWNVEVIKHILSYIDDR